MKIFWVVYLLLLGPGFFQYGCETKDRPASVVGGVKDLPGEEQRESCATYNPLKNVFFGDLHVHTSLSFDAWIWGVRSQPKDAYRFAKGEAIPLEPVAGDGGGRGYIRLARPLDFAAVVDHGDLLAEVEACVNPPSTVYSSLTCALFRRGDFLSTVVMTTPLAFPNPKRSRQLCGSGKVDCSLLAQQVWTRLVEAAEEAYDRSSACSFTSFPGYEYTGTPGVSNRHRIVVFKNNAVPERPITYFEAPTLEEFWKELDASCLESSTGCDVIAIPHNSNLSNGGAFYVSYANGQDESVQREVAALQQKIEPLVEIFQHKGDSECMNGLQGVETDPDPMCDFEKIREAGARQCGDRPGFLGDVRAGCISRRDYVRYGLFEGLKEDRRIGINPFMVGFIANTDTHNSIAGHVVEERYVGHSGNRDDTPQKRLTEQDNLVHNPGGLTAVWAEENTRNAIFAAFKRREVYATSGPRIEVRFFGGWEYPATICRDYDIVRVGYERGVPMGAVLPPKPEHARAPMFVVWARQEQEYQGRKGRPLQRIQIIKGWLRGGQHLSVRVFEVAGSPENGASVDLATCQPVGEGFEVLCNVWTDPEFDPAQPAFYYARVLENPSCRWTGYECTRLSQEDRPETCSDPSIVKIIQERAWASPIWYRPHP